MMSKLRVLIAGIRKGDTHQAVRHLKRMGIDIEYTSGDPGEKFDINCDAVILLNFWLSHTKFAQVKNAYKNRGIPTFSIEKGQGWSHMKQEFDDWVAEKHEQMAVLEEPPPAKAKMNVMEKAFKEAEVKAQPPVTEAKPTRIIGGREVLGEEDMKKIHRITKECYEAGLSTKDTVDMLHAEGLRKVDGSEFDRSYVSTLRYRLKNNPGEAPEVATAEASKPQVKAPRRTLTMTEKLELIGKVLGSALPQEKKLVIVDGIYKDEIYGEKFYSTKRESLQGEEIMRVFHTSIFESENKLLLILSKVQAQAIVGSIEAIKEFAN